MNTVDENLVPVIVSNSYEKKYYLDSRLNSLPKEIRDNIKIMFVTLTENVGGCVEVLFDTKNYDLCFRAYKDDDDYDYDEINANYKLSRLEKDNAEFFEKIAMFCKFKLNNLV